jgi:DNA polymerase
MRGRSADHPGAESFFPERRSLGAFARAVQDCRGCPLYLGATQAVFGEGPRDARLVLVGEQPGDREDRQGHVFVGAAGRVLDDCLAEVGIPRDRVWLTNAVKHFKFEQRGKRRIHKKPSQTEVQACFPWLSAELEMLAPRMIVCLGATATRAVLGTRVAVMRDRGRVFPSAWCEWTMPTVHPSALLRVPDEDREQARADFVRDLAIAAARFQAIDDGHAVKLRRSPGQGPGQERASLTTRA